MADIPPEKNSRAIEKLLSRSDIWCATTRATHTQSISTGLRQLDKALHQEGWPCHGLTELLLSTPGCGELRLMAPCLSKLSQSPGLISFIAPPYIPYAPGLLAYGIDVSRILVIRPESTADALWATEQALRSGACNSVLSWLPEASISHHQLRKLQLAAQQMQGLSVLIRSTQAAQRNSPAALRAQVFVEQNTYRLNIIKQRGGWGGQRITLPLPKQLAQRQLPVHQLPVYNKRRPATPDEAQGMQALPDMQVFGNHSHLAIH